MSQYITRECVIFMGIQGSGKSSFFAHKFQDTHIRISLDMLKTKHREKDFFETCLKSQQSFVIDNLNILLSEREDYIKKAKENHFKVIGYFLHSNIKDCLYRNNKRESHKRVAPSVISSRYNNIQMPSASEGFDELYYVSIIDGEFCIEKFNSDFLKDEQRPKIVSRKLSIITNDYIDWENIIYSVAWEKDVFIEIEKSPNTKKPLALISTVGPERNIVDFSKIIFEKIEEETKKIPVFDCRRGYFSLFRWSNKENEYLKESIDLGLKMNILQEKRSVLFKTIFYEIDGKRDDVRSFISKLSSKQKP